MLIDILGALFFFTIGIIIGRNTKEPHEKREIDTPTWVEVPYPAKDQLFLYGHSRMYWWHQREYDKDENKRCMTIEDYAKLHSACNG